MINVRSVLAILLLLFFAVLMVEAWRITGLAGLYPRILVATVLALTAWVVVAEGRHNRRLADIDAELAGLWPASPGPRARLVAYAGIWVLYTALLPALGFVAATTLAIAASLWCTGFRRPLAVLAIAVLFSVGMAVLLKTVLYVPMPIGAADLLIERFLYSLRP